MTTDSDNTPIAPDTDNLDDFENEFFGKKTDHSEKNKVEEPVEETPDDDTVATEHEDEPEDPVEPKEDPEEEPTEEKTGKKKSRFQERIDDLTAKHKEQERVATDLAAKLNEAIQKLNEQAEKSKPAPDLVEIDDGEPNPDELLPDGALKYELGELDPQYRRDYAKYLKELTIKTIREETEAAKVEEAKKVKAHEIEEARTALTTEWSGRLEAAKEQYPDMEVGNETLQEAFSAIDVGYGEYLASTIMSMEHGPEVLHYLGQNLEEAQRIVASGPAKATIALGRLEAKFLKDEEAPKTRTSSAPTPPPTTRGSATRTAVSGDTDDLELFEKAFFNNKK